MTELNEKDAVKKYGKEAKDGAVELTTIANNGTAMNATLNNAFSELAKESQFPESISGNAPNSRYITVTTTIRENTNEAGPSEIIIGDEDQQRNATFLIQKTSKEGDLNYYKLGLQKMGIVVRYSLVERNEVGEITAIKIELTDTKDGAKSSAAWDASRNSGGIPDILVGRKAGGLRLSSSN
jgi:hypothetical protein